MTYALVVGAAPVDGEDRFYRDLLAGAATVVAADAAGEWCIGLGRTPDVVVGDFDSALPGAEERLRRSGCEVVAFDRDKDLTDLELAIDAAVARTAAPVVLTAAFSHRIDHTLAAVGSLTRAGGGAQVREPGWRAWVCDPACPVRFDAEAGVVVSVLSLGRATGVNVTGAAWSLDGAGLGPLSGRGVSNVALGGELSVSVDSGSLIVMLMDGVRGTIY